MTSKKETENTPLESMSFGDHFGQLRKTLVHSLVILILTTIAALSQINTAWEIFLKPLPEGARNSITNLSPTEALTADFRLAFWIGLLTASPVLFWKIYAFVAPAMYKKERGSFVFLVFSSFVCFGLGSSFSFFVVLPLALHFLASYSDQVATVAWTQTHYLSFLLHMTLTFAIIFELPVVSGFLAKLGILNSEFMIKQFKLALIVILVLASVLTPPDVISQFLLAVPMLILYLLSILIVKRIEKKQVDA